VTVYTTPSNTLTPTGDTNDGGTGISLGMVVVTTVAGTTATGLRWWAPVAGATISPFLQNTAGTVLATGSSITAAAGWNTLPFSAPFTMTQSVDYLVGVFQATTQRYSAVSGALTSNIVNGPITIDATTGSAGRYNYSTTPGLFYGSQASTAWFGVDVVATDVVGANVYSATGTLPIALGLTGAAVAKGVATGNMPVVIGLTGAVVKRAKATGTTPLILGMTGAAKAVLATTGTMPIQLGLTGSTGASAATGSLGLGIALTGTATAVYATTGTMTLSVGMTGVAVEGYVVTGTLPLTIGLAGAVTKIVAATGQLPLNLALTPTDSIRYTLTGTMPLELGMIGIASGGTERDITVTATLGARRWDAELTTRTRTATLGQRRYGATLG